jgi:hypothetical protein
MKGERSFVSLYATKFTIVKIAPEGMGCQGETKEMARWGAGEREGQRVDIDRRIKRLGEGITRR